VISGDLTSNDPTVQTFRESGGLTYDVTDAENFTTIISVAPSPIEQGTLWVGTDDGRIHVTRDGGDSWNRIDERARGVPAGTWVPMIAPSPHDAGTAFVVFDDHRRSNMQAYVYRTENYGRSWTSLASDELSGYALSVLQDPEDQNLLFLGTEFGLFFSTDGGDSWTKFTAGVPTVSVMDMAIQQRENDLVLGTHGRSIFVLDDYSALRSLDRSDFNERLKILSVTPGQQYDANQTPSTRFTGSGEFRAENEPYGVMVTFMASGGDLPHPDEDQERERSIRVRQQAIPGQHADVDDEFQEEDEDDKPKVEITVRTLDGELIRTVRRPVHQGINRVVWGMEHDGVRPAPGPEKPKLEDGLPDGPEVPPGDYEITLRLALEGSGENLATATATVLADPRSHASQDARQANYQALLALQDLQETSVTALERIVQARSDVDTVLDLISKQQDAEEDEDLEALKTQAIEVKRGLKEIEEIFRVPPSTKGVPYADNKVSNMIGLAGFYISSSLDAPTAPANVYVEMARVKLDEALDALNTFMGTEIGAFTSAVSAAGIGLFSTTSPVNREDQ
jgi:hypothetical protein